MAVRRAQRGTGVSSRWDTLTALFDEARGLSKEAREQFLTERCRDDASLRSELERLLAANDRAGDFIETPALAHIAATPGGNDNAVNGKTFGAYRVVSEIARGGMGAVYLAERVDGEFQHRAALKLIKRGMDTDLVLQRFRAERQILATLEHPNIARLLDGGSSDDGRPYFIMEYIEGRPIDHYANDHNLAAPDRVALFLDVCGAVEYAHRQLVVHRDIKPGNVLVTKDGVAKLLDFGIAKVLEPGEPEATGTITAVRLLTPEYASPEQIDGRRATVRSDVYSLGVVLYKLLTGASPYRLDSRDPISVANAVRTFEPEPPARLRRELRGDLDTIVMTALRKEPDRRYQTVAELSEDLRRHLAGRPIRAKRDRLAYRAAKFVRRNRVAAIGAVGTAVALAIAAWRWPGTTQSGVLSSRDRIVVADFTGGDSSLSAAVAEALRVDLAQSSYVQLLSQRQIRSGLERMARAPGVALDDSLARELAIREGVKAFVTGSAVRVAGKYTLAAQLVGAEKGELLAAFRETASDSGDVIPAIGRLSASMRERMGESLRNVRATPSLAQVTTPSLEALRLYTDGLRLTRAGQRENAVALFKRAVAIDTGFASAYRTLGNNSADQSATGPTMEYFAHAIANQERLPFYERYQTIASHAMNYLNDYPKAIAAFEHVLSRYPDDVVALNNLGYAYAAERKFAQQESLLVRAIAVDSTITSLHLTLAMAAVNNGDYDAARRQIEWVAARDSNFHNLRLARIYLPVSQQRWADAERMARARIAATTNDSSDLIDGFETLSGIVTTRGRLAEGERLSRDAMRLARKLDAPGRFMTSALRIAMVDLRLRGDTAAAIGEAERALLAFPKDSVTEGDWHYDDFARLFAAAGRVARARELVSLAEHRQVDRAQKINPDRHWALGAIAAAEGRASEAIAELRVADSTHGCPICVLPDLARAYAAAGQRDSTVAVYERYLALPWEWRFETDDTELMPALTELRALYFARGDTARASAMSARRSALMQTADVYSRTR